MLHNIYVKIHTNTLYICVQKKNTHQHTLYIAKLKHPFCVRTHGFEKKYIYIYTLTSLHLSHLLRVTVCLNL